MLRSISSSIAFSTGSFSASARVCCAAHHAGAHKPPTRIPAPANIPTDRINFKAPPSFTPYSLVPGPYSLFRHRKDRWPRRSLRLLLRLHLAHQHRRSHCAHRNRPRLRPALPVEHRSEEHTSELQSLRHLVCRLLLEKKK